MIATVEIARRHRVPLIPRGAGTGLAGQAIGRGLILDFSNYMNRVIEVNPEERRVRVEPGVVLDELNQRLKPHGLFFPPDPATAKAANSFVTILATPQFFLTIPHSTQVSVCSACIFD